VFATAIDRTGQRRNGHAPLAGDFLKTVPELVFEADTRFVTRIRADPLSACLREAHDAKEPTLRKDVSLVRKRAWDVPLQSRQHVRKN
jgi:hypothetical protein